MKGLLGWISFVFTAIGATWLAFIGDSIYPWLIYIVAATTGIIHNKKEKNNSMLITFAFYLLMNVIALIRNVIW
jgi:hypothetical protein